ncbi:MAG: SH3 domain-containing protein [Bacteroidia bacterium]|nr:SH3 domain-containing protein [Bacteroidia bacterium]
MTQTIKTITFCLFALWTFQVSSQTHHVTAVQLNLREGPGTDFVVVKVLNQGDQVAVISSSGKWMWVTAGEDTGYVSATYLAPITQSSGISLAEALQMTTPQPPAARPYSRPAPAYRVLICMGASAYAYHTHYCSGLNRCRSEVVSVAEAQAVQMGRTPCRYCY